MNEVISLEQFWNYLNPDNSVIELRIQEKGQTWLKSHFVRSYSEVAPNLNNAINKTIYYGINPRKEAMNNIYSLKYITENPEKNVIKQTLKGSLPHIDKIRFIGLDIDVKREATTAATPEQLTKAKELMDMIIDELKLNNYVMVFSGNGLQLIAKIPEVESPHLEYVINKHKGYDILTYKIDKTYSNYRDYYKNVVDYLDDKFSEFQKFNGLELDTKTSDVTRVLRLPNSYNIKIKPRKVICMKFKDEGENTHLVNLIKTIKPKKRNAIEVKKTFNNLTVKQLAEEPLVKQLLLNENLPVGNRNHLLEQALSRMIAESGLNINDSDLMELIGEINAVQNKQIQVDPLRLPPKFTEAKELVVRYCIETLIPPVYEVLEHLPNKYPEFEYINEFNNEQLNISREYFEQKYETIFIQYLNYLSKLEKIDYSNIKIIIILLKNNFNNKEINRLLFLGLQSKMDKEIFEYYNKYIFKNLICKLVKTDKVVDN